MSEKPEIALPPALVQPGCIARMQFNLGENERLLSFETYFDRDESLAEVNARLDTMRKAGDRQRAKHLLRVYLRSKEAVEYELGENRKLLAAKKAAIAEADTIRDELRETKRAAYAEGLVNLTAQLGQIEAELRERHYAARHGEYVHRPTKETAAVQTKIDKLTEAHEAEMDALTKGQQIDHGEADVRISEVENVIKEKTRAIEQWVISIADMEALAADEAG